METDTATVDFRHVCRIVKSNC